MSTVREFKVGEMYNGYSWSFETNVACWQFWPAYERGGEGRVRACLHCTPPVLDIGLFAGPNGYKEDHLYWQLPRAIRANQDCYDEVVLCLDCVLEALNLKGREL